MAATAYSQEDYSRCRCHKLPARNSVNGGTQLEHACTTLRFSPCYIVYFCLLYSHFSLHTCFCLVSFYFYHSFLPSSSDRRGPRQVTDAPSPSSFAGLFYVLRLAESSLVIEKKIFMGGINFYTAHSLFHLSLYLV